MRILAAVVGFIVAAMAIDVLLGLLNPDRLLPTELCGMIGDLGMSASLFMILALFIFTPARPPTQRSFAFRIPVADSAFSNGVSTAASR